MYTGTTTNAFSLKQCEYCHQYHTGHCPNVKAIEYYRSGQVKRVEFHQPAPQVMSITPYATTPDDLSQYCMAMSVPALAKIWDTPEEDAAWAHLQGEANP